MACPKPAVSRACAESPGRAAPARWPRSAWRPARRGTAPGSSPRVAGQAENITRPAVPRSIRCSGTRSGLCRRAISRVSRVSRTKRPAGITGRKCGLSATTRCSSRYSSRSTPGIGASCAHLAKVVNDEPGDDRDPPRRWRGDRRRGRGRGPCARATRRARRRRSGCTGSPAPSPMPRRAGGACSPAARAFPTSTGRRPRRRGGSTDGHRWPQMDTDGHETPHRSPPITTKNSKP